MVGTVNRTDPIDSSDLQAILAEADRRGLKLQAYDGRLRYSPHSAMTPDLAAHLKAHKPALLNLLARSAADRTEPTDAVITGDHIETGVLSVVSVSEAGEPPEALWSEDELAILARSGTSVTDLPLVSAVKSAFAGIGATVVSVESKYGRGGWTRRQAAKLIRRARGRSPAEGVFMRCVWAERLAICMIDGELSEGEAERIALSDLEKINSL